MPKLTIMMDGAVLTELTLTKELTTLGRRPYNDIVLDHLTVSGEHAVLHMLGGHVTVEDLHSTNGTYLGGKSISREELRHGDILEMGNYRLEFEVESSATPASPALAESAASRRPDAALATEPRRGLIKVLSGPAAGREMLLAKAVTTIGKPAVSVAVITQRHNSYFAHHVEGAERMSINDEAIGESPCVLQSGDRIKIAGTEMQFFLA